ncbi:tumor suppressor candidate 2-like [Biomphalaria glabrata]|uniref:Tumor suppressor candidate 2-like n=1 Tax=Biomphalaria glabrata TaxID=6526 RepID=A0A9W3A7V1_BIOGL|nr:tumor suppressor candidate 2-like [Biomphalaria glabrata]KAI8728087.1 tumor suppressor candidate 2 [Biomphalaria glabrata]
MGQAASSVSKLVSSPITWFRGSDKQKRSDGLTQNGLIPKGATLFVFKRRGSMFFDEDGDLAHEFYCEEKDIHTKKVVMRQYNRNLIPEGDVDLPYPRLHGDLPVILFDTSSLQIQPSSPPHSAG